MSETPKIGRGATEFMLSCGWLCSAFSSSRTLFWCQLCACGISWSCLVSICSCLHVNIFWKAESIIYAIILHSPHSGMPLVHVPSSRHWRVVFPLREYPSGQVYDRLLNNPFVLSVYDTSCPSGRTWQEPGKRRKQITYSKSEYDKETQQSHTADQPMAPWGNALEHLQ